MGEGWVGVTTAGDLRGCMKKHPSCGAHDRARVLRRQMTEAERRVWQMLRMRQVNGCRFRRQAPIGRYIVDFVCHEARLIIEVDGGQHDAAAQPEAERSRFFEGQGYRILRFWNNEVLENREGVLMTIAAALAAASPPRDHPHPTPEGSPPPQPSPIEGEGVM
jgi:very-short-patch-repair endonuclease